MLMPTFMERSICPSVRWYEAQSQLPPSPEGGLFPTDWEEGALFRKKPGFS